MAGPDLKQKVHGQIQEALEGAPTAAASKKLVSELEQAMLKSLQAIKAGADPDLLTTYRRQLQSKLGDAAFMASEADAVLQLLKGIGADDAAFAAGGKELTQAQESMTGIRTSLADSVVKGRKVEERAKAEAAKGEKSEKTAHREWDVMVEEFEEFDKSMISQLKSYRSACEAAKAAVKARDSKVLAEQKELIAKKGKLFSYSLDMDLSTAKLTAFTKKFDITTFSKEFRDEMAQDRKTVSEYDKRRSAAAPEMEQILSQAAGFRIEPPDAVKVTAKLGFKANFNNRVEKALKLNESNLAKELEAIGKDAGVKGTGKDFITKLRKEGMYP